MERSTCAALLAAAAALSLSLVSHAAPVYHLEILDTLGGSISRASAINNRGQVVGESSTRDGQLRATLWDRGETIDLGLPAGDFTRTVANDINNRGEIAGIAIKDTADTFGADAKAVIWRNTEIQTIGTLGPGRVENAEAINDSGTVVGRSIPRRGEPASTGRDAFIWSKNEGMRSLDAGLEDDQVLQVTSINNRGQVTLSAGGGQGYLASEGQERVALAAPLDPVTGELGSSFAAGINNKGQVVGGGGPNAVLWNTPDEAIVLPDLLERTSALDFIPSSQAIAINERGWIVGSSRSVRSNAELDPGQLAQNASLWIGQQIFDLNELIRNPFGGFKLNYATDINERNQIVGRGRLTLFGDAVGRDLGFILTVVPDPGSLSLMGFLLCIVALRQKRQA